MTEHLLDTDTLSFYMKGNQSVRGHVQEYLTLSEFNHLTITEITYYEIRAGLEYVQAKKKLLLFDSFIASCRIVKLTKDSLNVAAYWYGKLRRGGIQIGTPDLLIAGTAIHEGYVLVTNNGKHYQPIEDLTIVNWKH